VTRSRDRARFCGCCCNISRRALLVILAVMYLAIAALSMISVGGGVTANMTEYQGQVKLSNSSNFKVTNVAGSRLHLWTGWLKFNNGKATDSLQDLTNLSQASGALGYITAFLLLVSAIVAIWKLSMIAMCGCCGAGSVRRRSVCLGISLSIILILFLASFYAITSRDLDNLAHGSLAIPAGNDISMKPAFAWYCGFFAAVVWVMVSIFSCGMPAEVSQEYHQF